ncbi:hypothetical protein FHX77_000814 [Bifidobacterium commune]|nr:hypothetical protein [Bifidobacterium commune]
MRYPQAYCARIRDIQDNPTLTANKKADKIEKVYQRWLYSLTPKAFDEYAKTRRNYDKKGKLRVRAWQKQIPSN